jgi:hypothetical protein
MIVKPVRRHYKSCIQNKRGRVFSGTRPKAKLGGSTSEEELMVDPLPHILEFTEPRVAAT